MNIIKPKFWDKNKINFYLFALLPLTFIVKINNFFLNNKTKFKSEKIISICVGNIYVGGTGKTPLTIKLYKILSQLNQRTVVAKKYYENQLDEISLLKKKTNFLSGIKRIEILKKSIKKKNQVVIFDDGLQDREIDYDLKFVCFNAANWIGNGQLIPLGPLRENPESLKKYDAIFLNTTSGIDKNVVSKIKKIDPLIKIFKFKYEIKNLKNFNLKKKYLIFSGIGNPDNFKKLLQNNKFNVVLQKVYPDHHKYNDIELKKIIKDAKMLNAKILTTEKDFSKIPKIYQKKITSLNVELVINNNKSFINFIKGKIVKLK